MDDEREQKLARQFEQLLDSQRFEPQALDRALLQKHLDLLARFESISAGAISVFDLDRREHVYFSPRFGTDFGWDLERLEKEGIAYSNTLIHPGDRLLLMESGIYFTKLAFSIAPERRRRYKLYTDYRMKRPNGGFVRVTEQQSALESDRHGNLWLALSVLDRSPYNDVQTPARCRMVDATTGELFLFPPPEAGQKDLLSLREREILQLISKGLVSREIADLLYISVNTVNTHRQRIISKLEVSSTFFFGLIARS